MDRRGMRGGREMFHMPYVGVVMHVCNHVNCIELYPLASVS